MTKNEFDILSYVSMQGSPALSDLHTQFAKVFSSNYVVMDLVIIHLLQLEYLKSEPALDNRLDPYAVFLLTPAGAHAMDEYSETTSRIDRVEKSARNANIIAGVSAFFSFVLVIVTLYIGLNPN